MAQRKTTTTKKSTENQDNLVKQEIEQVSKPVDYQVSREVQEPSWEIKDRFYYLANNLSPLSYKLKCRDIYYFDEDKGYERELLYTRNQKTVFVDEMNGPKTLEHVVFRNGVLMVPKNLQTLQKLLSIYHPHKGTVYFERDDVKVAADEVINIELELEALNAAASMDVDQAEAIMRVEIGSQVDRMSSKELKRDLFIFAKRNPALFIELMNDDNVHLRNIGVKATEKGVITLSRDNRTFSWGSTNRKLMTVPFDEHPYSALAAWFKTDEGMEVLTSIEKRLKE